MSRSASPVICPELVVEQMVVQLAGALVVLSVIGLASIADHEPWLVPSLASAVFVQVLEASQPSARTWSIGIGQMTGLIGGFTGVYTAAATTAPVFPADHPLVLSRVLVIVVAILVPLALQFVSHAKNAAAGALPLLVALGVKKPDWSTAWRLIVGIVVITALGEIARRATLAAACPTPAVPFQAPHRGLCVDRHKEPRWQIMS